MSKLTLDALKSKADAVASNDLLATISGGTENDCHTPPMDECDDCAHQTQTVGAGAVAHGWWHILFH